jgi:hypothetical protein
VIDFDQRCFGGPTVNDTRRTACRAETAARTRTLLGALKSDKFHNLLLKESTATSAIPGLKKVLDHCTVQRHPHFVSDKKS